MSTAGWATPRSSTKSPDCSAVDRKDDAAKAVPDELVDDSAIVGDIDYVRKQIVAWEAAGVTMMVIGARSPEQIHEAAALL